MINQIESTIELNWPYVPRDKMLEHTEGFGGGIYLISTYATFFNSSISRNENYNGGGIWISSNKLKIFSLITMQNMTFFNNTARFDAGGIYLSEECTNMTINIIESNFTRNLGEETGGAISTFFKNDNVLIFLYKCLIDKNRSVLGGGVCL